MKTDGKRHEITTHEGFSGYINPKVVNYFEEKYSAASFKVVPGHWTSMETKDDVDKWIEKMDKITKLVF